MNMVNGLTVILLVLLLDIAVIWSVIHSVRQQKYKLLYILIILLIPILGVAIYYLTSNPQLSSSASFLRLNVLSSLN